MMGAIYSKAARVIVWVGPDEQRIAELAISVVKKYNRLVEKQVTPEQFFSKWGPLDDPDSTVTTEQLRYVEILFKKPWFTRVWVIQEVCMAKDVLFTWGSAKVDFAEIIQFICAWGTQHGTKFYGIVFLSNYLGSLFSYIWASYIPSEIETYETAWFKNSLLLQYEAQAMRQKRSLEFEDIISRCRILLRATDTRDFVYAFLSHPTAKTVDGKPIVEADYTISVAELRLRLFSMVSRCSLRFLGLVWHTYEEELALGPSWCPHFDSIKYSQINGRYDACLAQSSTFRGTFITRVECNCLNTSALLIDEIHLCGEVAGHIEKNFGPGVYGDLRRTMHEVMERYWSLAEQTNAKYSSAYADRPIAFACTLLVTIEQDEFRVVAKAFYEFCQDRCPSIYKHLQNGWLESWGPSQTAGFLPFLERSISTILSERFFTTKKGYFGMGSPLVQPGDSICVLPTTQTPLVIRQVEGKETTYQVICSCYVYGMKIQLQ